MAFDGAGIFNRLYKWTQDAANNINITASRADGEDDGFAAGLTNCVTRDGQGKMTADFLPNADNTLNIGSALKRWATLNGVPVANLPVTQQNIGLLLYPQVAAEVTASVTPTFYYYPVGNVLRYGADPTGVANSYTAFANAIAVCKINGNTITVPAGNFKIDTASGTLTCSYVTFLGTGVTAGASSPAAGGSVLSIVGTANSPFTMGPGVTFDGIGFFYPAQVDSFTPIVFPPTMITSLAIAGAINFVYIQNCTVFNAYRFFVDTDTTGAIGHVFVDNNTIYGILTCFEIAHNSEIITFTGNEFTFGHYLAATETGLRKFTRANGTVLQMPRTDGVTFNGNVLYGYLNGIWFNTTAGLLCQLTSITANYFDTTLFSILATGAGNVSGLTIAANSFISYNPQLTTAVGNAIKITTTGTTTEQIAISANNFSLCSGDEVNTSGTATRNLTITGNTFTAWALNSTAVRYGALNIGGASTSYSAIGNQFISQVATWASGIIGTCSTALISSNVFGNCFNAINAVYGTIISVSNLSFNTADTASNIYTGSGVITDLGCTWDKDAVKVTGFGTPAGPGVIANFPGGGPATLAQCSTTIAEILVILKSKGMIGA